MTQITAEPHAHLSSADALAKTTMTADRAVLQFEVESTVEADGAEKYRDQQAAVREKEREQVLRDLGYRSVRWLSKEIMARPDVVVDRVRRQLGAS